MENQNTIIESCTHFLHGHGPLQPKQYFQEMSTYTTSTTSRDIYGTGAGLQAFESQVADLLGFEEGLFMISGTMAQQIALRIWADDKQNSLVAFHPTCHLEVHEHDSYKLLHHLEAQWVGGKNQVIRLEDFQQLTQKPSVVLLELPQREIGGQLPSWEELVDQVNYLKAANIRVHLDGARLWECSPYYQKSYKEIASLFDSAYVSFYKGIGAVSGAMLLGPQTFIKEAKIWNRRHGGNLYTSFPNYLSAQKGFEQKVAGKHNRFNEYYHKTLEIYEALKSHPSLVFLPSPPQVNMFHLTLKGTREHLFEKSLEFARRERIWLFSYLKETSAEEHVFEWYIGEGALKVSTDKIVEYVDFLFGPI